MFMARDYHLSDSEVNTKVVHVCDELQAVEKESIGERLKRLREAAGLSQAELAAAVGYKAQSTIGNIESGTRGYGAKIVDIAAVLGTTPDYLRVREGSTPASHLQAVKCPLSMDLQRAIAGLSEDGLHKLENQLRVQLDLPTLTTQPAKKQGNGHS